MTFKLSILSLAIVSGITVSATEITTQEQKEVTVNKQVITSQNALGFYLLTRLENELKVVNEDRNKLSDVDSETIKNNDLDSIYKESEKDTSINGAPALAAEYNIDVSGSDIESKDANKGGAVHETVGDLTNEELVIARKELLEKETLIDEKDAELIKLKGHLEKQLRVGKITQNYFYKTGEFEIFGEQEKIIADSLLSLSQNSKIKLHIIGRADPRGNKTFNEALAQKRINFVKNLAEENGFSDNRVSYINMGEVGSEHSDSEMYFFQRHLTIIIELK